MAINALLGALRAQVDAPIFITQHLPASFMPFFAGQLARTQQRPVFVAEDGMMVAKGAIYLAPGDGHLTLARVGKSLRIVIDRTPVDHGACPSVDPMMASVGAIYGAAACGVTLSGMGRDGASGSRMLRSEGGLVIAQDSDSSVVWGMPGSVAREGVAHHVLNPVAIATLINSIVAGQTV
jgi:two-component system, chemotaxis family, protein-glutamate methylesterase/glutaminase